MEKEKRMVLPLLGSPFEPGEAQNMVDQWAEEEMRDMVRAEYFYFSGKAQECADIVKAYLDHERLDVRLTACLLYCFSSLPQGNICGAKKSVAIIRESLDRAWKENWENEQKAWCVFAAYLSTVLLHLVPEGLPDMEEYVKYLPVGNRLYTMYIVAHETYLEGDYARALGMAQSAMMLTEKVYPIPMLYLQCLISMCYINLKEQEKARETFMEAWEMARKDKFLEPFIEHHGLFQGMVESCIRKTEPQLYKQVVHGVIAFSRGWMKIHNPTSNNKVTKELTPMEFSIAMLACRDWTNQEIGEYLDLSVNTVKHYVSRILEKLNINKREQIKEFVNQ